MCGRTRLVQVYILFWFLLLEVVVNVISCNCEPEMYCNLVSVDVSVIYQTYSVFTMVDLC